MKVLEIHVGYGSECPYAPTEGNLVGRKFCECKIDMEDVNQTCKYLYYVPNTSTKELFFTDTPALNTILNLKAEDILGFENSYMDTTTIIEQEKMQEIKEIMKKAYDMIK